MKAWGIAWRLGGGNGRRLGFAMLIAAAIACGGAPMAFAAEYAGASQAAAPSYPSAAIEAADVPTVAVDNRMDGAIALHAPVTVVDSSAGVSGHASAATGEGSSSEQEADSPASAEASSSSAASIGDPGDASEEANIPRLLLMMAIGAGAAVILLLGARRRR